MDFQKLKHLKITKFECLLNHNSYNFGRIDMFSLKDNSSKELKCGFCGCKMTRSASNENFLVFA